MPGVSRRTRGRRSSSSHPTGAIRSAVAGGCGATETRARHEWGPWRYVGRDSFLLKLRQVRTCGRCGVEKQQEFERAF
jgi:hypothetical protein